MNLRSDPYEKAHEQSFLYDEWTMNHLYLLLPAQDIVGEFLMTFKDYPQRQPIGSFSLDKVLEAITEAKRNWLPWAKIGSFSLDQVLDKHSERKH